jgi:sulfite reductase beta subunit-like hemoprotein
VTADQFDGLAALQRRLGVEVRVTNRQNVVFRGLEERQLSDLYAGLVALDLARPGAELARDVVSCPGADTCNLAVTQSRGLAAAIDTALDSAGLAEVGGVRVNISGCSNSCGQHHTADIGFFGVERRAHGRSAPGYQLLLGGHLGDAAVEFGRKAVRLPAKACADAAVRIVGRFAAEREAAETFSAWLARAGGATEVAAGLADLAEIPAPEAAPDFYVDFGEAVPFNAEVGASECAG